MGFSIQQSELEICSSLKISAPKPNIFCGRKLGGCWTCLNFGYMDLKVRARRETKGSTVTISSVFIAVQQYKCWQATGETGPCVTETVKLGHNIKFLPRRLWAGGSDTLRCRCVCAQGGSWCLILRQPEYNISHWNTLPFLSSSLLGVLYSD